jgi:type I restriction enzyme S subunit
MKLDEIKSKSRFPTLAEVPSYWKITSIKHILQIPITDGPHTTPRLYDEGIPFISAEAIKNGKIDFDKKRGYISLDDYTFFSNKYVPKKNDIYMVKSGATTGNIAIVETDEIFTIWSPLAVFRANKNKVQPIFLLYYLGSSNLRYLVELNWSYGTQQNIGMGVLSDLPICYPSLIEQTKISNYLDYKTSLVDNLITKKEQLIEKLKEQRQAIINEAVTKGLNPNVQMKDSGIAWLGEIPDSWDVIKLKHLVKHSTEKGNGDTLLKISLSNIESKTGRLIHSDLQEFEGELKRFKKNDILFNKLRPYLTKVLLAKENGECVSELLVFTANKNKITPLFLFHRLISEQFISVVDGSTYGAKMPRASVDFILNLEITVPPIKEQESIINQLEKLNSSILKLIQEQEKSILKLTNYRQSLISEAVTGKIDVRDWQVPTNN